jgi:hypothetical protein
MGTEENKPVSENAASLCKDFPQSAEILAVGTAIDGIDKLHCENGGI